MDEVAARNYVADLANKSDHRRYVFLVVELNILDSPVQMSSDGRGVDFKGKISKITVYSTRDNHHPDKPIGILFP